MNILKGARNALELSQEDVAKRLHLSRQQVGNYESRRQMPPLDKVKEIADVYGISVEKVVEHFDTTPPVRKL